MLPGSPRLKLNRRFWLNGNRNWRRRDEKKSASSSAGAGARNRRMTCSPVCSSNSRLQLQTTARVLPSGATWACGFGPPSLNDNAPRMPRRRVDLVNSKPGKWWIAAQTGGNPLVLHRVRLTPSLRWVLRGKRAVRKPSRLHDISLTPSLLWTPQRKGRVALPTPPAAPARQEEVYNALSNGQVAAATL
jgi:hypothetical protein